MLAQLVKDSPGTLFRGEFVNYCSVLITLRVMNEPAKTLGFCLGFITQSVMSTILHTLGAKGDSLPAIAMQFL